jgi:hypothetical protein
MTPLSEVFDFLDFAEGKHFWNDNTVQARRTACKKLFDIIDDESRRTVEYVSENLEVLKKRFSNMYTDVRGATIEEYGRRAQLVLTGFSEWKTDRPKWEREQAAKESSRPADDSERRARTARSAKPAQNGHQPDTGTTRTVTIPVRPSVDLTITMPKEGLKVEDLQKLAYFLLPYASDWQPPAGGFGGSIITPKLEDN